MTAFTRNLFSNAGATAVSSLIQFVLILGLSRWLTMDEFATFLTASSVIAVGEMGSDFGCRIWASRQFAVTTRVRPVLYPAIIAKGIFSCISALLILILPFDLLTFPLTIAVVCIAVTQPITDPFLWFLRGRERLDIEATTLLLWRVGNASVIAFLAYIGKGVPLLLVAWLISNLVRIWGEWHLSALRPIREERTIVSELWSKGIVVVRTSFPIGLAFLLMTLYQRSGVLLLGQVADASAVAAYGAAFTLVASAGFVGTSITVASFPSLVRALEKKDWERATVMASRKLLLITMLFWPGCLIGGLLAPWIVPILYPDRLGETAKVIIALFPGLYVSTVNFALKYLMNAIGLNWVDAISAFMGIVVFASLILLPEWRQPAVAAGWAWAGGEAAIFIVKWIALWRNDRMRCLRLGYLLMAFLLLGGILWWYERFGAVSAEFGF